MPRKKKTEQEKKYDLTININENLLNKVDELIEKNVLKFEKFIGLTNVPGPNWVMHNNVNEGVICSKI